MLIITNSFMVSVVCASHISFILGISYAPYLIFLLSLSNDSRSNFENIHTKANYYYYYYY